MRSGLQVGDRPLPEAPEVTSVEFELVVVSIGSKHTQASLNPNITEQFPSMLLVDIFQAFLQIVSNL